jgi:hypothetical protein
MVSGVIVAIPAPASVLSITAGTDDALGAVASSFSACDFSSTVDFISPIPYSEFEAKLRGLFGACRIEPRVERGPRDDNQTANSYMRNGAIGA